MGYQFQQTYSVMKFYKLHDKLSYSSVNPTLITSPIRSVQHNLFHVTSVPRNVIGRGEEIHNSYS